MTRNSSFKSAIQKDMDMRYRRSMQELKKLKLDKDTESKVREIIFWAMVETGSCYVKYSATLVAPKQ